MIGVVQNVFQKSATNPKDLMDFFRLQKSTPSLNLVKNVIHLNLNTLVNQPMLLLVRKLKENIGD